MSRLPSTDAGFAAGAEANEMAKPAPGEPEAGKTMRIDMLVGDGDEEIIEAPPKQKMPRYMLVMIVVLVVAAGVLFGMRKIGLGAGRALGGDPVTIDYDVTQHDEKTGEHLKVLDELAGDRAASQVPVENVQRNPFMLADSLRPKAAEPEKPDESAAEKAARKAAEARRQKIRQTLASLKINGILDGSNPVVRINGQAYRVGDVVADLFTVKAIHGREIELFVDDDVYILSMGDINNENTHLVDEK